jgi:hypothetical protein
VPARRRTVGSVVGAMLIAAACGFPQVSYTNDGGGGSDGSLDHKQNDPDSPFSEGSSSGADGATGDGNDASYDSGYTFEAAPDAPSCDEDLDMYLGEASYLGMPPQDMTCVDAGGNDCDDRDSRANPGVGDNYQLYPAHPPTNGDWNCDGIVEKKYAINVTCPLTTVGCATTEGFTGDPICGLQGPYITCKTGTIILCSVDQTTMVTQACR